MADVVDIELCLLARLRNETVGHESHAAAFFFVEEVHTTAQSVEHFHHVHAQLRVVVVDVATVEETDVSWELDMR